MFDTVLFATAIKEPSNARAFFAFHASQAVEYLKSSRSGLACVEFEAIERASTGWDERVLAAFNLGIAAATAGELSRAEAAFTRALAALATEGASRNITEVGEGSRISKFNCFLASFSYIVDDIVTVAVVGSPSNPFRLFLEPP